jgi:hypothetical protein
MGFEIVVGPWRWLRLVSTITGYVLSVHDEYDDTAVALHMWGGIAVTAVSLVLLQK